MTTVASHADDAVQTRDKLEVLDVLWAIDDDGSRLPVKKADAVDRLRASGQPGAARLVEALADTRGILDTDAVDAATLAVHLELARLNEFVHVPQLMAHALRPVVERLRDASDGPIRVVDLACGIGYDVRVLAATRALGDGIEYSGIDLNSMLVQAARRLAAAEDVAVTFSQGDAFRPAAWIEDPDRTVVISSGFLHHVARERLVELFSVTAQTRLAAFAHFDINPGMWANIGGWALHRTRMREPISRHDGTMSMRRSFTSVELLERAATGTAGDYALRCDTATRLYPRPDQIVRPLTGVRCDLETMP